ncbi:MAG: DUF87 domain-containing protein, partial [Chloroflexi bacterium]|nr:DUF87 domain-containing protein [Chloroflexota bacterium]
FYLGATYDLATNQRRETPINYDARDLTTHAVVVGMTGSGKTGLCVDLMEEAALDLVPAILIDPKGDITNLLLQFPELGPEDFQTWINEDDARRKGQSVAEFAQTTAETWRDGLADWGITPQRIRDLQAAVNYTIFTPGSDAGVPINILGSLAAPKMDFEAEAEVIRERISGTVAALLGLVDDTADPTRSREAILLANIFEFYWKQNKDLDLAQLILAIQTPPVRQVGVFDVDTFYPQKDRFALAMGFNNLMASPSFQAWMQGEALDVDQLFFSPDGKPRHSIFYIAHLSDSERMFFVTLLLENVLIWVRRQSGTTSLRALLYIDEIFGYMPPTAVPPSKRPLLTLLKQARASGLGVVIVTQNPVDLDYKGLTNAGTWFIGKLQAERDKARVVEGLAGAIAATGNATKINYGQLINQLSNRVFLMHSIHLEQPVVFQTRWAMSYLRGPLTRPQVQALMKDRKRPAVINAPEPPVDAAAVTQPPAALRPTPPLPPTPSPVPPLRPVLAPPPPSAPSAPAGFSPVPPALDPSVTQVYLPIVVEERTALRQAMKDIGPQITADQVLLVYEAAILGATTVRFADRKRQIDEQDDQILLAPVHEQVSAVDWADAERLPITLRDLLQQPERVGADQGPIFATAPAQANSAKQLKRIASDLADWLYYNRKLSRQVHQTLGLTQSSGESERDFKIRLQQVARERRDQDVDKVEKQYATQLDRLQSRLRKEEQELAGAEAEYTGRKQQEIVGIGETVLGFFWGRRSTRALSTAASRRRMTAASGRNVEETRQDIEDLKQDLARLEQAMKAQTDAITFKWAGILDELTTEDITPKRADITVQLVALVWLPSWLVTYNDGSRRRMITIAAYELPTVG